MEFMDELEDTWKIMNYKYTSHIVKFNKDMVFPLLTDGWKEMKDVFDFTDQQDVTLFYHGNNIFGIISSKPLQNYQQLPTYHSHAVILGHTSHFCVRLTNDIINNPYLVICYQFVPNLFFYLY
jgi:hypothetical protein